MENRSVIVSNIEIEDRQDHYFIKDRRKALRNGQIVLACIWFLWGFIKFYNSGFDISASWVYILFMLLWILLFFGALKIDISTKILKSEIKDISTKKQLFSRKVITVTHNGKKRELGPLKEADHERLSIFFSKTLKN